MRFRFILGTMVLVASLGAWAQRQAPASKPAKPLKAKSSSEFKVSNDANPRPNTGVVSVPRSSSGKSLDKIEHETPKGTNKASSRKVAALTPPQKEKPAPKINVKPQKSAGSGRAAPDPYKGRLKQKGQH